MSTEKKGTLSITAHSRTENMSSCLSNLISLDRPIIFAHQSDLQQPFIKGLLIKLLLIYRDFCHLWTDFSEGVLNTDCIFFHKCLTWRGSHMLCGLLCCLLERVITGQLVTLQQELLQWPQWLSDSSVTVKFKKIIFYSQHFWIWTLEAEVIGPWFWALLSDISASVIQIMVVWCASFFISWRI